MLGARTKQVYSYGRRGRRIVSVSEERHRPRDENLGTDPWRDVPSPLPARQADPPSTFDMPNTPSPRPIRRPRHRKVMVSPVSSPSPPKARKLSSKANSPLPKLKTSRRPLSVQSPNVIKSPAFALTQAKKRAKVSGSKGTPLKQIHSPTVDVEIINLDDRGRRVSQEKRTLRPDVQANPFVSNQKRTPLSPFSHRHQDVIYISDSEDEAPAPKPAKRLKTYTKPLVISSDESEPEIISLPSPDASRSHGSTTQTNTYLDERLIVRSVISIPSTASTSSSIVHVAPRPDTLLTRPLPPRREVVIPPSPALARFRSIYSRAPPTSPPPPRSIPRKLTPIRYGRSNFPRPPSPPSPTTPTDLDLSVDFGELSISLPDSATYPPVAQPAHLLPLLDECGQDTPHEFSAFIDTFPYDPIVRSCFHSDEEMENVAFQKIGEASYSEVFGIGDVVLKIIPIRDEGMISSEHGLRVDTETPSPSDAKDVLKEMIVTSAMGEICDGFIKLIRTYVVRGKYPSLLLALWDEYNERKGSESIRPDSFTVSQIYAIIVLPNGGPDLEAYTFSNASKTGWRQACSIFWQTARALSQAEELVSFEHRDLHWGQILVKDIPSKPTSHKAGVTTMDHPSVGVKATIIDLGLARMDGGSDTTAIHWTPFDEEIFEGEGDYQFDVYRLMRKCNGGEWEKFNPLTNVLWLHYLALKLLNSKRLRPPTVRKNAAPVSNSGYPERECYECLKEMEKFLAARVKAIKKPPSQEGRRKTQASAKAVAAVIPQNATDVLDFGSTRRWVDP
ncbi:hypothetical protein EVG20_g1023 [Dentipellis fragilis]|uniref:non-specific serine/threonine protein kinase n=1 Tax=Dentipellis fragilis TaxID=205917 RepID=A0A4Y9ZBP9_9AGAM|nr:hypothetical protein EVG20_g1023 [Dentipellis fragilis]